MQAESLNALSQLIPFVVLAALAAVAYVIVVRFPRQPAAICVITAHARGRAEEDEIPYGQLHRMAELAERFGWGVDRETHKYFKYTNHKFWFIPASEYLKDKSAREYRRVAATVEAADLPVVVLMTCAKDRRQNDDGTPKQGRTFRSRSDNDL